MLRVQFNHHYISGIVSEVVRSRQWETALTRSFTWYVDLVKGAGLLALFNIHYDCRGGSIYPHGQDCWWYHYSRLLFGKS